MFVSYFYMLQEAMYSESVNEHVDFCRFGTLSSEGCMRLLEVMGSAICCKMLCVTRVTVTRLHIFSVEWK